MVGIASDALVPASGPRSGLVLATQKLDGITGRGTRFDRVPRTPLPPPLPPETRTVGQLVAEALKLYGARFWPSLALGIGPAIFGVADSELDGAARVIFDVLVGPLVFSASYGGAVALVRPIGRGRYGVPADLPGEALQRLPGDQPDGDRVARVLRSRGPCGTRRAPRLRRRAQAGRATCPRGLHPRAWLTRNAPHYHLPDRSRVVLLVARAERPGVTRRGASGASRPHSGLHAGRRDPVRRPGSESRVGPPTEEEARCRHTFCFRV